MIDRADIDIMLARADNITEGTIDRFSRDFWGIDETDYAMRLIDDLAKALRQALNTTEVSR